MPEGRPLPRRLSDPVRVPIVELDITHIIPLGLGCGACFALAAFAPDDWYFFGVPVSGVLFLGGPILLFLISKAVSFWFPRGFFLAALEALFRPKVFSPHRPDPQNRFYLLETDRRRESPQK